MPRRPKSRAPKRGLPAASVALHSTLPASMLALLVVAGCVPSDPADLGPGVIGVYLGNDTEVLSLLHLRSGAGVVLATQTSTDVGAPAVPISGASFTAQTTQHPVLAVAADDGVYQTPLSTAAALAPGSDSVVFVGDVDGEQLGLEALLPPILPIDAQRLVATEGEPLVVELPDRWARDYDYVLVQVFDMKGQVVWDNLPQGFGEWLDTLANPPRPGQIEIPKGTWSTPGTYALGVVFLVQLDQVATYTGPLNEPASGVWGGTAWLVPVDVAP